MGIHHVGDQASNAPSADYDRTRLSPILVGKLGRSLDPPRDHAS